MTNARWWKNLISWWVDSFWGSCSFRLPRGGKLNVSSDSLMRLENTPCKSRIDSDLNTRLVICHFILGCCTGECWYGIRLLKEELKYFFGHLFKRWRDKTIMLSVVCTLKRIEMGCWPETTRQKVVVYIIHIDLALAVKAWRIKINDLLQLDTVTQMRKSQCIYLSYINYKMVSWLLWLRLREAGLLVCFCLIHTHSC